MRFLQFAYKHKPNDIRVGYIEGECVMDINARTPAMPKTMMGFLSDSYYLKRIMELKEDKPCCVTSLKDVIIKAPIHNMNKLLGLGHNYYDHCEVHNVKIPEEPVIFSKLPSTVIGHGEAIQIRTDVVRKVDYEVELAVVMGRTATCVKSADAYDYVFGCTIGQDITARDWVKKNNNHNFLGKSMDTFCPLGPWIVTMDELGDPNNLDLKCNLNGVYKQKSNTSQQIFKIPDIIERLSSIMTLFPGDTILMGTPAGIGVYSNPPEFLKPGDVLRSEIHNIGVLETRVEQYRIPEHLLL